MKSAISRFNIDELEKVARALEPFPRVRWRMNPVKMPATKMPRWLDREIYERLVSFYLAYQKTHSRRVKLGERSQLTHASGEYFTDKRDTCNAGATVFGLVANGDVVTCIVNRSQVLGNINSGSSLVEIWQKASISYCKNLCPLHWPAQRASR